MLIAKGYRVNLKLENGRKVRAPASYGLLHDPSGRDWAKCSSLIAPFQKTGDEVSDGEAKSYFGSEPREGRIALPPKSLGAWHRVGPVVEIEYTRRRPGRLPADHQADYYHPFEGKHPMLYRIGKLLRLELGSGCSWNWRGLIRP